MATIKQAEKFEGVNSNQVYDALMSSKEHSEFTGANAKIENKVGGKISAWDDYITGENTVLKPGKLIVQNWHASDWPDNAWSEAKFELKDTNDGCELTFTQTNVPDDFANDIEQGWIDNYWQPMREYFSK
jgi:activator of HSP90 ATPase